MPSTLLWQKLVADVEANAPWQKLRRSLLLLLQLLLVLILAFLVARPFVERPAGPGPRPRARHRRLGVHGCDRRAPRPASTPPRPPPWTRSRTCRPGGKVERRRRGPDRTGRRQRHDRPRQRQAGDRVDRADLRRRRPGRRAPPRVRAGGALGRCRDPRRHRRRDRDPARGAPSTCRCASSRSAASATTRRSSRWRSGRRPAACRTRRSCPSRTSASTMVERRVQLFADGVLRDSRVLVLDPQRKTDIVIDDVTTRTTPPRSSRCGWSPRTRPRPARPTRWRSTTGRGRSSRPTGCGPSCSSATATPTSRTRSRSCPTSSCTASRPTTTARAPGPSCSTSSSSRASCRRSCRPSRSSPSRRRGRRRWAR